MLAWATSGINGWFYVGNYGCRYDRQPVLLHRPVTSMFLALAISPDCWPAGCTSDRPRRAHRGPATPAATACWPPPCWRSPHHRAAGGGPDGPRDSSSAIPPTPTLGQFRGTDEEQLRDGRRGARRSRYQRRDCARRRARSGAGTVCSVARTRSASPQRRQRQPRPVAPFVPTPERSTTTARRTSRTSGSGSPAAPAAATDRSVNGSKVFLPFGLDPRPHP